MIASPTIESRLPEEALEHQTHRRDDLYAVIEALTGKFIGFKSGLVLVFIHSGVPSFLYLILTRGSTTMYSRSDSRMPNTVRTAMNIL